jgi:CheY-like chemotaxis protein
MRECVTRDDELGYGGRKMKDGSLCILVVDDRRNMAKTLAAILRVSGYETDTAGSSPEALQKIAHSIAPNLQADPGPVSTGSPSGPSVRAGAQSGQDQVCSHYDCVFSDVRMPGMNGVELCRQIKARLPDLPVVLMTAYSTDALVQEGLEEGVVAVLSKPLDLDFVLALCASLPDRLAEFLAEAHYQPGKVLMRSSSR